MSLRALLVAASLILAVPNAASAAIVDRVAAVVNDDVITLSEVYELGGEFIEQRVQGAPDRDIARRDAEIEVLDSLILRRLISQEIDRLGLEISDIDIDRAIDDIARRNNIEREQLRREVEGQGLPWSDYREEVRESLRQYQFNEAVIRPRIAVDENELLDAYKRTVNAADLPVLAELGAIFLALPPEADEAGRAEVLARATAARDRIRGGESFATVAAELDQGPYGAQGGKMGTYRQGELVGDLDTVAFALQPGQVSDPVVTPQGVFLLTVFSRKQQDAVAFEDVRDQLFEQVYASRIEEETDQWYRQARRKAAVLVKLETPGGG